MLLYKQSEMFSSESVGIKLYVYEAELVLVHRAADVHSGLKVSFGLYIHMLEVRLKKKRWNSSQVFLPKKS